MESEIAAGIYGELEEAIEVIDQMERSEAGEKAAEAGAGAAAATATTDDVEGGGLAREDALEAELVGREAEFDAPSISRRGAFRFCVHGHGEH